MFVLDFCRLHKFLLQPRGVKPVESISNEGSEQVCSLKAKKVVGKVRVEGMVFTSLIWFRYLTYPVTVLCHPDTM